MEKLRIDGHTLTLEAAGKAAEGGFHVVLDREAKKEISRTRRVLERNIESGKVMYGVNTGFGRFADITIPRTRLKQLQRNIVFSHATGTGPPLSDACVRLILLLKANSLASGYSGIRPAVIEYLLALYNHDVLPVIPSKGSVGASGDLAPLAHMALVLLGQGTAKVRGKIISGRRALSAIGLKPLELGPKEGLALLNGTQVMCSVGLLAWLRANHLYRSADVVSALSIEALSGSLNPFDSRIQKARGHAGQKMVAANIRKLLRNSPILRQKPIKRVQEPYSLRCIPQVHGAGRDLLDFVRRILETEINAATDNPLVFGESGAVLSGGNFHGEPLALAMDGLGMAVSGLAGISERRIASMMDSHATGLPGFLAYEEGIHSGFMIAQVQAAALVSENKVLAHPASVDSVPTSANQEDYVSMGMTAALKAMQILENTEKVVAVELLCAAQAVELRGIEAAPATKALKTAFRQEVKSLGRDRILSPDIEKATAFLKDKMQKIILQFTIG
jgi:histidine ammonia-lyase